MIPGGGVEGVAKCSEELQSWSVVQLLAPRIEGMFSPKKVDYQETACALKVQTKCYYYISISHKGLYNRRTAGKGLPILETIYDRLKETMTGNSRNSWRRHGPLHST